MKFLRWRERSIPVLTYHSLNVDQNIYEGNDHLAFESDLQTIHDLGMKIVPLSKVVDWLEGQIPDKEIKGAVALTLDDGSSLDFHDVVHPTCDVQISIFNLLRTFQSRIGQSCQHSLHVSSFAICSPEARAELDRKILIGKGWWGDDWWAQAQASGLMSIECHSWDHVHESLDRVEQQDNLKGDFKLVETYSDCSNQVTAAADYIERITNSRPSFFAYPWGDSSEYLSSEFMPNHQNEHKFRAAFSIEPKHVTKTDNVWNLPRYVCGRDWKTPAELVSILKNKA